MANVKICDKCNKILRSNEKHYIVSSYSRGPVTETGLSIDLCQDCYIEFKNCIKPFNNQIN